MTVLFENEIIRSVLRGNVNDFEKLVTAYEKNVYNIALRMVGDPDDAADMQKVTRLAAALERGAPLPPVSVFEKDCDYYVRGGVCSALAYAFAGATYVPCRLVRGAVGDRRYVCVQNSL